MNIKKLFSDEKIKKYLVPAFFIFYLLIALNIYDDYGTFTDDNLERSIGTYALVYSLNQVAELVHADSVTEKIRKQVDPDFYLTYEHNVYGTAFQIPVLIAEAAFFGIKKTPNKGIFELRHLMTFLFCYTGFIFFYFLIREISGRKIVAFVTTMMLILTPRMFAESFYNCKDLVFLSSSIIAMFFYVRFLKEKTLKYGILLGMSAAYSTGIRFLGVQFIMLAVFFICLDFFIKRTITKKEVISTSAAVLSYVFLVIFFYPASWHAPVSFFAGLFNKMSAYPHDVTQLFMGEWYEGTNIPWYYIPVWMFITIPVLFTGLFLHGLYLSVKKLISVDTIRELSFESKVLLSAVIMFLPLFGVIIKGSVLYNGWRHLYFLYLPILIITSVSVNHILSTLKDKRNLVVVYSIMGVYFFSLAVWIAVNHPYQYSFFNAIPRNIESNFEKDSWSISILDGMKYVLKNDPSEKIIIKRSRGTAKHSRNMLPKELKNRLDVEPANPDEFDYFFYNGDSFGNKNYAIEKNLSEVHSIRVYNSIYTQKYRIMSIYKNNRE